MFNTMTMVKIAGGVLGAFLILLLGNWVATSYYTINASGHGAEGEEHAMGYNIAPADDGHATEEAVVEEVSVADILAAGDAAKGAKVFGKCKACHKIDGGDATGPHLNGVVGRTVATVEGFGYSQAMRDHGGDWTPEALYEFLANPKGVTPGTKMSFAGLKKETDRANLIAYLATLEG